MVGPRLKPERLVSNLCPACPLCKPLGHLSPVRSGPLQCSGERVAHTRLFRNFRLRASFSWVTLRLRKFRLYFISPQILLPIYPLKRVGCLGQFAQWLERPLGTCYGHLIIEYLVFVKHSTNRKALSNTLSHLIPTTSL